MANLFSLIQIYPALNKMASDLTSYMSGGAGGTEMRERILRHKLDDIVKENERIRLLVEQALAGAKPKSTRSIGTQTDAVAVTGYGEEEVAVTTPGRVVSYCSQQSLYNVSEDE